MRRISPAPSMSTLVSGRMRCTPLTGGGALLSLPNTFHSDGSSLPNRHSATERTPMRRSAITSLLTDTASAIQTSWRLPASSSYANQLSPLARSNCGIAPESRAASHASSTVIGSVGPCATQS